MDRFGRGGATEALLIRYNRNTIAAFPISQGFVWGAASDQGTRPRARSAKSNGSEARSSGRRSARHIRAKPPKRPRALLSGPDLPVAAHAIFERAKLLDPDGAARVHAPGRDANLGAEAELAPVGELGRGVVHDDRRIDLFQEALSRGSVLGHDAVGVVRAVGLDMSDRHIETVDDPDGDDRVEIFRAPVLLARRRDPLVRLARRGVAAHRAA